MNNAYYTVPIKEDIVHLQNIFEDSDEESLTTKRVMVMTQVLMSQYSRTWQKWR
jgi:hypothetical protein